MQYLSLFTGAGGGDLAMQHLLGFKCMGYVEYEPYCQKVIQQRIADGYLDSAPIWGDIRDFIKDGIAEEYEGMVDLVSGGPPCQPFSVAGKRKGADDARNMWPATLEVIRIVRPRWAFLENVRGLLGSGYFATVLEGLADLGMDARWGVRSAADCGADHLRERIWIIANARSERQSGSRKSASSFDAAQNPFREASGLVRAFRKGALPYVCGEHHGMADGMDRLTALGGGWVPIVATSAWRILSGDAR